MKYRRLLFPPIALYIILLTLVGLFRNKHDRWRIVRHSEDVMDWMNYER